MSTALLDMTLDFVRGTFSKKEVAEVKEYGGEFSGQEIDKVGYVCPAILIAVLGWAPGATGKRLVGRNTRAVHMAAFIATKSAAGRGKRMREAMSLAERLALALRAWIPQEGERPYTVAPLDTDPSCENLYGRAVDKAGQALWLVRWEQDIQAHPPAGQLFELLSVELTSNAHPGIVPAAESAQAKRLRMSHEINFPQQEP